MRESSPTKSARDGPAPCEKRVVIVEDDGEVSDLLCAIVRSRGVGADVVSDGRRAYDAIKTASPGLVILDLMLPGLAGFEVLRQLQTGATSGIPVLVISGRYTDALTSSMIRNQSNVADFMEKPVKAEQIIALLDRTLKPAIRPARA